MKNIFNDVWDWLANAQVGAAVGNVVGLIAVLGAMLTAVRILTPRLRSILSMLSSAFTNVVRRVSLRQKVHCLRLRWAVLFSNPDSILKLTAWRLDEVDENEFAYAQAVVGNIEEAKALNPARAAWAIALVSHPSEALDYLRPKKSESPENLMTFDSIAQLRDGLRSEGEVKEWQQKTALTVPLAYTIDFFAKKKKTCSSPSA